MLRYLFFFCDLNFFCDARGPCFKKCFTGKKGRHQTFVSLLFNYGQIPIDRLRRRRTCGRSLAEFNEWLSPTVCIHFQGRLPQPFHAAEDAAPATVHGRQVWCSRGGIRSQDAGRERGSHECQGRETRGSRGTPPHDTGTACCKQPGVSPAHTGPARPVTARPNRPLFRMRTAAIVSNANSGSTRGRVQRQNILG